LKFSAVLICVERESLSSPETGHAIIHFRKMRNVTPSFKDETTAAAAAAAAAS
jgi:hypothetical protein